MLLAQSTTEDYIRAKTDRQTDRQSQRQRQTDRQRQRERQRAKWGRANPYLLLQNYV